MSITLRSSFLDFLKGIAIIVIVLFHAGILTYGYLGVEVFFVLAGYLTTQSMVRAFERKDFNYWKFIRNRLVRLWPLVIMICAVSLLLGYFYMLPSNYKNVSETALGTLFFLNNFVQYITAGDYWDVSNDYKPLMHTWYLGVLFQFYLFYPLLLMITHRFTKRWKRSSIILLICFGMASLLLYLLPFISTPLNFYMLPNRFFEFAVGALVALLPTCKNKSVDNRKITASIIFLCILFVSGLDLEHTKLILILTVAITAWILYTYSYSKSIDAVESRYLHWIVELGVASYSIYLWHQVFFAFYRYIINDTLSVWEYIGLIGCSIVFGYLSYVFIERSLSSLMKAYKSAKLLIPASCFALTILIGYLSYKLYMCNGVVRDIPELEIYKDKPETWEPQFYNASVSDHDIDFPHNGKKNVLIVGDSYARDWFNVLCEAHVDSFMNMSYHYVRDAVLENRIMHADYIFLAVYGDFTPYFDYIPRIMSKHFYLVGTKRFFSTAGVIYNHYPKDAGYYHQTVLPPEDVAEVNQHDYDVFREKFIDPMKVMKNADGSYRIFTPEGKLISHDGLHLTRAGAKYYASRMNIISYFKE